VVVTSVKTKKYVHQEPGKGIIFGIAGHYIPYQETVLDYNGRKVLYVIGQVIIESSCCKTGDWVYTIVPGYIVSWQDSTGADGLPVSEVEPITDATVREELTKIIRAKEDVFTIEFWEA
jgi:hypothetical protein